MKQNRSRTKDLFKISNIYINTMKSIEDIFIIILIFNYALQKKYVIFKYNFIKTNNFLLGNNGNIFIGYNKNVE